MFYKMNLDLWDCFRKSKTHIIAKFHRTDLVICNHSGEGKTPSYSQINIIHKSFAELQLWGVSDENPENNFFEFSMKMG